LTNPQGAKASIPPLDGEVRRKVASLAALKAEFPHLSPRIHVEQGDANVAVERFCAETDWKRTRAVMFLDPFGNQVGWKSLEAIARTGAIDLWYLFPAGLGVNRQISAAGEFDDKKASSLDFMLGTSEWREKFVAKIQRENLWGVRFGLARCI
jgi:three-Cys-motif partner protein